MLIKAKELREKRAKLVEDARAIMDKADLGADDEARFDELMAEADKLKAEIDRLERLADAEHDLSERVYQRAGREDITTGEAQRDMEAENEVFNAWLAGGMGMLNDEQRQIMGRFPGQFQRSAPDPERPVHRSQHRRRVIWCLTTSAPFSRRS